MADLFGLGLLLALAGRAGLLSRLWRHRWVRGVALATATGIVLGALVVYNDRKPAYWESAAMVVLWPFVFAAGIAAVMACLARPTSWTHAASRWSGLAFVGAISYGIYLFHPFVIDELTAPWFSEAQLYAPVGFVLVALAGTMLVAVLFHYGVERPGMAWGRRLAMSRSPQVPTSSPLPGRPTSDRGAAESAPDGAVLGGDRTGRMTATERLPHRL
jgi:peptidoglycan/LPS O-acetylase OafA/YrhL